MAKRIHLQKSLTPTHPLAVPGGGVLEVALRPHALALSVAAALTHGTTATLAKAEAPSAGGGGLEEGLDTGDVREFFLTKAVLPDLAGSILVVRRKEDGGWSVGLAKSTLPRVLSKEAVDNGWLPPLGRSGLPSSLEAVVPEAHRYWTAPTPEVAAQKRAELVASGFLNEELVKVVDGALRLCERRFFLYEPAAPGSGASPSTPAASPTTKSAGAPPAPAPAPLAALLAPFAAGPVYQPLQTGAGWGDALRAAVGKGDGLVFLSPPDHTTAGAMLGELAAAAPRCPWLVEYDATPAGLATLAKFSRPFTVGGVEGRAFAASFLPDPAAGVSWVPVVKGDEEPVVKTVNVAGIPVAIDRPAGYVQTGVGPDGAEWSRTYKLDYGFLSGTAGGDGEALDVFVGPNASADRAWWVTQKKADGTFDEYKLFLGFDGEDAVRKAYLDHIPEKFMGDVAEMPVPYLQSMLGVHPAVSAAKALFLAKSVSSQVVQLSKAAWGTDAPGGGEERYVLGVVLEPDVVDKQGDTYSADAVRETAHKYMQDYRKVGLMHEQVLPSDKVAILESYIAPSDLTIGGQPVKKGAWLLGVRVMDDGLWEQVKSGGLTGFSIGGNAVRVPEPSPPPATA